jgi:plasmid maintenance system antidote protein VapI
MDSHFHTRKPVAAILGVTERTVSQLIANGKLKAHRGPHGYVVTARSVRKFLRTRGDTPLRAVLRVEKIRLRVLARYLEITEAAASAIVRGVREPNDKTVERIAGFLGRSVDEIFPDRGRGAA